jgi:hypothetical protein
MEASMTTRYRIQLGDIGEGAATEELRVRGWEVDNLNHNKRNFPNCDLEAKKGDWLWRIQVKVCSVYAWISAGGVNTSICDGSPIFNRVPGYPNAQFILCLTPSVPAPKGTQPSAWRYFVLPVSVAEAAFRINVDAYFNGLKSDGTPRSKNGACQDFVGPGSFKSGTVPDHHEDYVPYEGRFDLLETHQ